MDKQINISIKTILLALLIFLSGYIVYRLGPVIGVIVIATFLVISLEPMVKKLMGLTFFNKPIPRAAAVVISYVLFILVVISIFTFGLPPVLTQFQKLMASLGSLDTNGFLSGLGISVSDFFPASADISSGVVSATRSVFSNISSFVSVLVISIYMSLDWVNIKETVITFFPKRTEEKARGVIIDIEKNIGNWVKGQLKLMLVVGVASFLGLLIIGVKYPLALGLISGVLEIVPSLGPLMSAVVAGVVGFAESPAKGIGTIVLFIIIQQVENNFLVPKIMRKVSGFSSLVVLIALLVGGEFFGIVGVILAVPSMMVASIIIKEVLGFPE